VSSGSAILLSRVPCSIWLRDVVVGEHEVERGGHDRADRDRVTGAARQGRPRQSGVKGQARLGSGLWLTTPRPRRAGRGPVPATDGQDLEPSGWITGERA
jgi:hypothetical protein